MFERASRAGLFLVLVLAMLAPANPALAQGDPPRVFKEVALGGRKKLYYALVLPNGFSPEKTYPVLLALPPGAQTREMVDAGLSSYWAKEAAQRGWIVVSPQGPDQELFRSGEASVFPALLDDVANRVNVEGGRFHLAGVSNGGRAAFRAACDNPRLFLSLTVLPGIPPEESDWSNLGALKGIPVTMFVGARDSRTWVRQSERAAEELRLLDVAVDFRVVEGEHVVQVAPAELFTILDRARTTEAPPAPNEPSAAELKRDAVGAALDAMHSAGEQLDVEAFLGHFASDAVFIGTAPGERLSMAELRARDGSALSSGAGWPAKVTGRSIVLAPGEELAWFDETLESPLLGPMRATGVMAYVPRDDAWAVKLYSVALAVPPEKLADVVATIGVGQPPAPSTPGGVEAPEAKPPVAPDAPSKPDDDDDGPDDDDAKAPAPSNEGQPR